MAIDLRAEHPCDVLDDQVCDAMMKDIKSGEYDALGVATRCETFSPLREHPPGPRVLRTKEFPLGLLGSEVRAHKRGGGTSQASELPHRHLPGGHRGHVGSVKAILVGKSRPWR